MSKAHCWRVLQFVAVILAMELAGRLHLSHAMGGETAKT